MTRNIKFYWKEGRCYADVPEFSEAENEMIAGANIWLSSLAGGALPIELEVSNLPLEGSSKIHQICADNFGTTYFLEENPDFLLWLCKVNNFVWGGTAPSTIYYKVVE